jgi:hypothetical protein
MKTSPCYLITCLSISLTPIYRKNCNSLNDLDGLHALKPFGKRTHTNDKRLGRLEMEKKGTKHSSTKERIISLETSKLRRDIVQIFHDHETAGHPGELGTYNAVRQHYWWPGLRTFVKNYVKGCGTCQQFKIDRSPSKPAYIPTEGANLSTFCKLFNGP